MYYEREIRVGFIMTVLAVAFVVFTIGITIKASYANPHWETITVVDKNVNPGQNHEMWLVYTENEVYCIKDLVFAGFFTSSDVYNELKVGESYNVYVSGKRWPLFSAYKVIRRAEKLQIAE